MPYGFNDDKTKRELYKFYPRTLSNNLITFYENDEGEMEIDFSNDQRFLQSPFLLINAMVYKSGQSERPNGTTSTSIIPNLFYQEAWEPLINWNFLNGCVLDDGAIMRVRVQFDLENKKLKFKCKMFNKNGSYGTDIGAYGISMIPSA